MRCNKCGVELVHGSRFCSNCGVPQSNNKPCYVHTEEYYFPPSYNTAGIKGTNELIIDVIIYSIFAILIGGWLYGTALVIIHTIQQLWYYDSLAYYKEGNYESAYTLCRRVKVLKIITVVVWVVSIVTVGVMFSILGAGVMFGFSLI